MEPRNLHDLLALLPRQSRLGSMVRARLTASASVLPSAMGLLTRVLVVEVPRREVPLADDEIFFACEDGFIEHRLLKLSYVDGRGAESERTVEPHGLQLGKTGWSLLTRDRTRDALRTFRIDRIRRVAVEETRFSPIDPRALAERTREETSE